MLSRFDGGRENPYPEDGNGGNAMKKIFAIITLLTVLLLSACNSKEVPQDLFTGMETHETEISETAADETVTRENITEVEKILSSQPVTETSESTGSATEETTKCTEESIASQVETTDSFSEQEKVAIPEQQMQSETTAVADPVEETKPSESAEETKTADPVETTPPSQEHNEEKKPEPTEAIEPSSETTSQPEETEPAPEFDINYWVGYAQNYAVSKGLVLSSAAVDCWDNPIGAGAHCIYLERDIQSRLNRYANDEDITDVWIWAKPTGDGRYDLYIGYA